VLYAVPALVAGALAGIWYFARRGEEGRAFACSCVYLAMMMGGAAAAMYPNLLVSTTNAAPNITVYNAHSGEYALSVGLIWWSFGMLLAAGYFVFVYRMFRGKIAG
jgi:cytochrome d ubiquinol oxidase subunit II